MSKTYLTVMVWLLIIIFLVPGVEAQAHVAGRKVVIDAGHGGDIPGSLQCPGLPEKDANYDVADRLREKLEDNGAIVYMTRDQNGDGVDDLLYGGEYDNEDRYTYANSTDGEILVSVHFNSSVDHSINYTQGLYAKWKKDIDLAATLHNQLFPSLTGVGDGGLWQYASGVILKAEMPATIQEVSFISNTAECALLTDGTGSRQAEIAQMLYNGIDAWFAGAVVPAKPGR